MTSLHLPPAADLQKACPSASMPFVNRVKVRMGRAGSRKDDRHAEVNLPLPWPRNPDVRPHAGEGRRADGRLPFWTSRSVRDDWTEGTAGDLIGYSIVEADYQAAARAFTDGLPFLSN